jgi:light-harvesting complex I chlorophyll a/b binding protein 3
MLYHIQVIHCRWAMLGAAGCIAPEILGKAGIGVDIRWFETGVIPPAGTYDKYWTDPYSLFFIEVVAMQFAELRRWQDFK